MITAHREGSYLAKAAASVQRNIEALLRVFDLEIEFLICLDNSDEVTKFLAASIDGAQIQTLDFGDVSQVRNFAVQLSQGKYVAFLDADDIWGDNWLISSYLRLTQLGYPENRVFHPQINYYFGEASTKHTSMVFEQISSQSPEFNPFILSTSNYWSALCLAPKKLFLRVPYKSSSEDLGVGFEDWTFNIDVLDRGYIHDVVPETVHFLRDKPRLSRRKMESGRARKFHPSQYWARLNDRAK